MSRIGKKPILIPEKVTVKIEGSEITVSGPKGELIRKIRPEIKVEVKDNNIVLSIQTETEHSNAFWGLFRSLIANMVIGVVDGFEKKLELSGLGYRGAVEGDDLVLQVGFSHPVKINTPSGITFSVDKNIIVVSGIDKGLVTQTASIIRKIKPCEPYKGKGIKYEGEKIRRKAGKRVASGA
ncbi:MAG: 50S ribosomal protein L6 [Patescibacteria group bacterium]|nr:50S ribosomal protein L6 [Patescibacteria group bacterium]MBU1876955.1 50S ribosomal protein L6 [Patescibacteria group bacterium]